MGRSRREARRSKRVRRPAWVAGLLGAVTGIALLAPSAASAASSCTSSATGVNQTTYECNIPTGTIGGYEVKQWVVLPQDLGGGPNGVPQLGADGHITHMETDVVDDVTGQPVPIQRLMLHHIVFTNLAHQDTTCAGKGYVGFGGTKDFGNTYAPQRFYAAGEERAKMTMPQGYGYRTKSPDHWAVVAMVMNHRSARRSRLHPLRGHGRHEPASDVRRHALLARRPRLPRRPDLQRPERRPEGQEGEEEEEAAARARRRAAAKHKKGHGKKGKKKQKKRAAAPTTDETEDFTFGPRAAT